jgi:hypothetical protein
MENLSEMFEFLKNYNDEKNLNEFKNHLERLNRNHGENPVMKFSRCTRQIQNLKWQNGKKNCFAILLFTNLPYHFQS